MNILILGEGFISKSLVSRLGDKHNITLVNHIDEIKSIDKYDCLIHFGENTNVQDSIDKPDVCFDENLIVSFKLLKLCKENNIHFIYPSTAMVYDSPIKGELISESSKEKPNNPYTSFKYAIEKIALSFFTTYDLPITILRLFNPYGPFQKPSEGVIANMLSRKMDSQKIIIYGDGLQTRDFVYVDDVADAFASVIGNKSSYGQVFNIGYGQDISIIDLALIIAGKKDNIEFKTHLHPKNEIKRLVCNNSKAKEILKWEPKISMQDGISKIQKLQN